MPFFKDEEARKRGNDRQKKRYATDPIFRARVLARGRDYRKNNPEYNKERDLLKDYGITIDDFNKLKVNQNNRCIICNEEFANSSPISRKACVDHNHKSGKIRGLLCWRCNVVLGHIEESIFILNRMRNYLMGGQPQTGLTVALASDKRPEAKPRLASEAFPNALTTATTE